MESRPDLKDYLTPDELQTYVGMIGTDDWCIHFDKTTRLCTNYENRPNFCTVDKAKFKVMYDVDDEDFTDFCKFCCAENIKDSYGELSLELERFEDTMGILEDELDARK
jgi:Fe-S-cluster containining protein